MGWALPARLVGIFVCDHLEAGFRPAHRGMSSITQPSASVIRQCALAAAVQEHKGRGDNALSARRRSKPTPRRQDEEGCTGGSRGAGRPKGLARPAGVPGRVVVNRVR